MMPLFIICGFDDLLSYFTTCSQPERKFSYHFIVWFAIPTLFNVCRSILWSTEPNAFAKSSRTRTVHLPLEIDVLACLRLILNLQLYIHGYGENQIGCHVVRNYFQNSYLVVDKLFLRIFLKRNLHHILVESDKVMLDFIYLSNGCW